MTRSATQITIALTMLAIVLPVPAAVSADDGPTDCGTDLYDWSTSGGDPGSTASGPYCKTSEEGVNCPELRPINGVASFHIKYSSSVSSITLSLSDDNFDVSAWVPCTYDNHGDYIPDPAGGTTSKAFVGAATVDRDTAFKYLYVFVLTAYTDEDTLEMAFASQGIYTTVVNS